MNQLTAIVTGASSGIGAATVRRLRQEGFRVFAVARRADRLEALAAETGAIALVADITDDASVASLVTQLEKAGGSFEILVNNAGGAFGMSAALEDDIANWQKMYDINVIGTLRVTQALLPMLKASGRGDIVNITSQAAYNVYPGGVGYNAAKFAERVFTQGIREELLGERIRVIEIAPGAVETEEFSMNRLGGDQERVAKIYQGYDPLQAEDIADAISWSVTRPHHVNIDSIRIMPRAQFSAQKIARES
ncbi:MAG: SDR family oxidoreductase [Microbacteriaceae bacterium]